MRDIPSLVQLCCPSIQYGEFMRYFEESFEAGNPLAIFFLSLQIARESVMKCRRDFKKCMEHMGNENKTKKRSKIKDKIYV